MRGDRRFSLAEVAALMKLTHANARERRRYVRRLLRRLEERDRTRYLHRDSERGKLYITLSALEQIMPWDPGTFGKLRSDVDAHAMRIRRVEHRVKKHDRSIEKLHDWSRRSAELLTEIATFQGPKGTTKGAGKTA